MLRVQNWNRKITVKSIIFALLLLNSAFAFAQNKVTGQVTDKTGEPLIGVSLLEVGTTNGSITDIDGNFTLNAPIGATVRFTYVGYLPLEIKTTKATMNVVLQEQENVFDEVVIVGYGKMSRKDVTSSITSIKADDLNKGGVYTTPGELLQGKVPGLAITTSSDPNANPSMTLRGASTFREGAAQEPYYVIDGIPGADLALVSPADIESIDVLRDASATAIYGSKAANGVIIVTTKKGKEGATQVTYNGYIAVDQVSKRWDVMNASQHRKYLNDNDKVLSSNDFIDPNTDTDWQKEVQRTGVSHNHNVSIIGGTPQTNYSVSLNYLENQGVIKGTEMDRTSLRSMLNTKTLKNRLDLGVSLNASISNSKYVPNNNQGLSVIDAMTYYLPEAPIYNNDGSFFENLTTSQYFNPVALIEQNSDDVRDKRMQGVVKGTLHIIEDVLTLDANASYESRTEDISRYNDISSNVNQHKGGFAFRSTNETIKKNIEVFSNYNQTFNEVHKVGAMLGYSWQENINDIYFQNTAQGFSNDELGYNNLGMSDYTGRPDYGNKLKNTLRTISIFGRANYSYDSKYLFQATVRRDGSSAFGINNQWGTFPSGSLAWRISEEPFIKNLNVFDDLKFRIGYGVSGNTLGFDPYISRVLYGRSGTFIDSTGEIATAIGAIRNPNPDLKWERTGMFNVGFDLGFFNNRLTATIEYYDKRTTDLIADYAVPTTEYLVSVLTTNVGEISNKGVELTINATPVHTKDWSWQTTLNLSHNKNNVESISNSEFAVDYFDQANLDAPGQSGARQQRIIEGKPLGTFYTWKWAGYNDDGVSEFYKKDGTKTTTPNDDDRVETGCAQPDLNFGWSNNIAYKNWSMSMFFTGVMGNEILNASRAALTQVGNVTQKNILTSVLDTDKPKDTNAHYLSDRYIEKGDYLRLSSLALSYTFNNFTDYIQNLRVYASCNNVFVLTNYKGIDPEINMGGLTPGIDSRNFYPKTRTFMFGASFSF